MKIVLYSTNSNYLSAFPRADDACGGRRSNRYSNAGSPAGTQDDGRDEAQPPVSYTRFPPRCKEWERMARAFPEHQFYVVTQQPGMFMLDVPPVGVRAAARTDSPVPAPVQYIVHELERTEDIAQLIAGLQPDAAVAASFWTAPYDWAPIKDAMIAQQLEQAGVRTVCHPPHAAAVCFDKYQTHQKLESLGFTVPRAVYVHHELFWCERGHHQVKTNVYKEYVLSQLRQLHYPIIIKETVGLSSYRMEVAVSYKQALAWLQSGKNSADHIVEEYIEGIQFGTEIYGTPGAYRVQPPFMFSVNKYGITSPKQSVKLGPVTGGAMQLSELNSMLTRLAESLGLSGIAQVDLVLSPQNGGTWYIIEINPRLSGMTESYAAAYGQNLYELILQAAGVLPAPQQRQPDFTCNIKLPLLTDAQMKRLHDVPYVVYVSRVHNREAKQEREKGYCELIFTAPTIPQLEQELEELAHDYADLMEESFVDGTRRMLRTLAEQTDTP